MRAGINTIWAINWNSGRGAIISSDRMWLMTSVLKCRQASRVRDHERHKLLFIFISITPNISPLLLSVRMAASRGTLLKRLKIILITLRPESGQFCLVWFSDYSFSRSSRFPLEPWTIQFPHIAEQYRSRLTPVPSRSLSIDFNTFVQLNLINKCIDSENECVEGKTKKKRRWHSGPSQTVNGLGRFSSHIFTVHSLHISLYISF